MFVNQQSPPPGRDGGDAVKDARREHRRHSPQRGGDLCGDVAAHPGGRSGHIKQHHTQQLNVRVLLPGLNQTLRDTGHPRHTRGVTLRGDDQPPGGAPGEQLQRGFPQAGSR